MNQNSDLVANGKFQAMMQLAIRLLEREPEGGEIWVHNYQNRPNLSEHNPDASECDCGAEVVKVLPKLQELH